MPIRSFGARFVATLKTTLPRTKFELDLLTYGAGATQPSGHCCCGAPADDALTRATFAEIPEG